MKENLNHDKSINDPVQESFQYQLDLLKMEIGIIDKAIARLDEINHHHKNWAILTWAGSIAVGLGQADLRRYIILTAVLPILFWIITARWASFVRGFIFREDKISQFLNDGRLLESFKQKRLVDFTLLDPRGFQHKMTDEYKQKVNIWRSLKYPEISILYLGMVFMSIAVGLFFILF